MEYLQQGEKCAIIIHEIYGVNDHIKHYAQLLFDAGYDVYVPSLLDDQVFSYAEEQAAYHHFITQVGFAQAQQQVLTLVEQLAPKYKHIQLIGFSVGATVAWLCSEHNAINKVICFYGSRIRDYTHIKPKAKILLFYGEQEQSFAPHILQQTLSFTPNVQVYIVEGMHGFADPYNRHYHAQSTKFCINICMQ